jgi:hypothetical protein
VSLQPTFDAAGAQPLSAIPLSLPPTSGSGRRTSIAASSAGRKSLEFAALGSRC